MIKQSNNENSHLNLPVNLDAEQNLLGSLLVDNDLIINVSDILEAEHFFVPLHNKIFQLIAKFQDRGMVANPVTLKNLLSTDEDLSSGLNMSIDEYLLNLTDLAFSAADVKTYTKLIYDAYIRRKLISIANNIVSDSQNESEEFDPNSRFEKIENDLYKLASKGKFESSYSMLSDSLKGALHRIAEAKKLGKEISGASSGFVDMDKLLGGLQPSDLIILAARPSMGKTSLAISMAINSAKYFLQESSQNKAKNSNEKNAKQIDDQSEKPKSVAFFSLEMSSEQIAIRMLATKANVDSGKIRIGNVNSEEFQKISMESGNLAKLPLLIDDTPAISIAALKTKARRLKRKYNLGLIFVDYLQLLRGSNKSYDNRVNEIGEISQGLKAIAKELNIPVIALSQLSRAVESREDKRPQLSDLRESGNIEQDADVVMFIFREEYYHSRKKPLSEMDETFLEWKKQHEKVKNLAEIIVAKQRNGPIGNVTLRFNSNTTEFSNFEYREFEI